MFNVNKPNTRGNPRSKKDKKQEKLRKIAWKQPGNTRRGK